MQPFPISGIFQSADDRAAENAVAVVLEHAWQCEVRHFGAMSPVDWYILRGGRMVGIVELKVRKIESIRYPTVFLSVAKWLCLTKWADGLGVPAGYVVAYTDCVRFIYLADVDAKVNRMAGRKGRGAEHDIEPMLEIPVERMQFVTSANRK